MRSERTGREGEGALTRASYLRFSPSSGGISFLSPVFFFSSRYAPNRNPASNGRVLRLRWVRDRIHRFFSRDSPAIHLMKYINESTGYFARRYSSPLRRILKAASKSFPR